MKLKTLKKSNKKLALKLMQATLLKKLEAESVTIWSQANIFLGEEKFSFKGHEYLRNIYEDTSKNIVIEKASQMGISTYALIKSAWAAINKGIKIIYYFPTTSDVETFSTDRFDNLFGSCRQIQSKIQKTNSVKIKKIGDGTLFFLGLFYAKKNREGKTGTKVKSIDADFLIFDELDEAQPKQKEAARHRIDHSKYKWTLELSTPTIPDYGIDAEFKMSDQKYWNIECEKCKCLNILEETFPHCLQANSAGVRMVCHFCKNELNPANGRWIAKNPDSKISGYHITQLFSSQIDLKSVYDAWRNPRIDKGLFYNHVLGIPFLACEDKITIEEIVACCNPQNSFINAYKPNFGEKTYMGIDVQKRSFFVCITKKRHGENPKIIYLNQVNLPATKTDDSFMPIDRLMKLFHISNCVVDAQPETHAASRFADRHRNKAYLCHYSDSSKYDIKWQERQGHEVGQVSANRTQSFDATFRQIQEEKIELPALDQKIEEFARHFQNIYRKRITNEDTGEIKFKYFANGDDHYAHARNYCRIAESKGNQRVFVAKVRGKRIY